MLKWFFVVLGLLCVAGPTWAQLDEVRMRIEQGYAGLDGSIRPGAWTPIRLSVDNLSADDRDVLFRWEHQDEDGDRVVAERQVTLTRQRDGQAVWLYAATPMTTGRDTRWALRAVDAESGELLASLAVQPNPDTLVRENQTLVAVTSSADLGLSDYQNHNTQQSPVKLIRGLSLDRLPDRWHGLEALSAFVWTQDLGGDPADPLQVSEASLSAMREWVFRGGHLVVMLPSVGQTWTSSPLADMLPVTAGQLRQRDTDRWWDAAWMGEPRPVNPESVRVTTFAVSEGDGRATVVLRDAQGNAVAVAGRYGFGRVTVLGLDLTAAVIQRSGLPRGPRRLWHEIFNWRYPLLAKSRVDELVKANSLVPASRLAQRRTIDLGHFIPGRIAMAGTIGALLSGAIVLFGVYWLLAGWLVQPILKRKGLERFSWVGFVALVLVFAGVAWGGAALLRPSRTSVAHVTVLDFDGNTGVARGRAFVSVFVPKFGRAEVATPSARIGPLSLEVHNLISSPGFSPKASESGFVDTQRYTVNAAQPDTAELPVRATSKQLLIDYLGYVDRDTPGLAEPFSIGAARGIVAGADGWPVGKIIHTLPGELTNVRVIFCRGEAFDARGKKRQLAPLTWRYVNAKGENRWLPGQAMELAGPIKNRTPLYGPNRAYRLLAIERDWKNEGLLGQRLGEIKGGPIDLPTSVDDSVIARQFELLSFFDALPPPAIKRDPKDLSWSKGFVVTRRLGQRLDLTPLLAGRRLIILGHLKNTPLPLPFTIDGQTPESSGHTVVRWVYDF